jgi:hypothetical protein
MIYDMDDRYDMDDIRRECEEDDFRREFEAWCEENDLDPNDEDAHYTYCDGLDYEDTLRSLPY